MLKMTTNGPVKTHNPPDSPLERRRAFGIPLKVTPGMGGTMESVSGGQRSRSCHAGLKSQASEDRNQPGRGDTGVTGEPMELLGSYGEHGIEPATFLGYRCCSAPSHRFPTAACAEGFAAEHKHIVIFEYSVLNRLLLLENLGKYFIFQPVIGSASSAGNKGGAGNDSGKADQRVPIKKIKLSSPHKSCCITSAGCQRRTNKWKSRQQGNGNLGLEDLAKQCYWKRLKLALCGIH